MLCGIHPRGPAGMGVDFQETFAKKTCGRVIFFLGGGVGGKKLHCVSFFEEVFF